MLKAAVTVSDAVDAVVRRFMQASLLAIVLLVLLEVLFRNVVGQSIYWIEEVAVTYLGTWFVFIGASHALKTGMLVRFEFIANRLRGRGGRRVLAASQLGMLVFLLVVIVYGVELAGMALGQPSPALQLPMGLAYFGIVVGCALMVLHTGVSLLTGLGRGSEG